ncbi:MAG: hypothetical protein AB9869_00615 [Verrucomicrobiia bacterium]
MKTTTVRAQPQGNRLEDAPQVRNSEGESLERRQGMTDLEDAVYCAIAVMNMLADRLELSHCNKDVPDNQVFTCGCLNLARDTGKRLRLAFNCYTDSNPHGSPDY